MAVSERELPGSAVELATLTATVEIEEEDLMNGSSSMDRFSDTDLLRPGMPASDGGAVEQGPAPEERKAGAGQLGLSKLVLTSMVAAGVQFGWALQLSLLTPYIQQLGIEHAFSSFIWLCGPVTGLLVQPCIGMWSDRCELRWGRRRPFICAGVVMIAFSVLIIGYSADIGYVLGDSHEDCLVSKNVHRPRAVGVFILGFWLLDLANNTVQGPARALLADLSGSDQRDAANAIFCLWMAFGNVLGFSTGAYGNWYTMVPALTSKACCRDCANLKGAFLLAIVFLVICTTVTLVVAVETPLVPEKEKKLAGIEMRDVDEKKPEEDSAPLMLHKQGNGTLHDMAMVPIDLHHQNGNGSSMKEEKSQRVHIGEGESAQVSIPEGAGLGNGPGAVVVNLLLGVRQLPPAMKIVLLVMALCWLGWFPFFLFDTDWMGREVYQGDPTGNATQSSSYTDGVREGSFGLLLNSVVLGFSSLFIDPLCRKVGSKNLWAIGNFILFVVMACTGFVRMTVKALSGSHRPLTLGKVEAVILFTVLGFPLAITYSVPYSLTADLTATSNAGQGLAMGILNLAVVIPQTVVALGSGPWDDLFGGGNEPAFILASLSALLAGLIAVRKLPRLSRSGYERAPLAYGPH